MAEQLFQRIYAIVRGVPSGRVVSYGEVAKAAGLARGARLVGWALRALPAGTDVPWQRIVNREGVLSIVNPRVDASEQQRLLEKEGVIVREREGRLCVGREFFTTLL